MLESFIELPYNYPRPVTAILGPRQCGKTALARFFSSQQTSVYFDLENPTDYSRLENSLESLSSLKGLAVIDEAQKKRLYLKFFECFPIEKLQPAKFLILGSASLDMMRHSSEALAGRIGFVDMAGFSLEEIGQKQARRLWLRGGAKSFLAKTETMSVQWREDFIRTFLERDLPQLGIRILALTLRRFWTMVAYTHGQLWNGSEIANSLGVSHVMSRKYLDILTSAFVLRQITPWYANVGKRIVKSPKVYVRDTGLLHALLRLDDFRSLEGHPKLGFSWEGFVIEQIINSIGDRDVYFWATHGGAEMDLIFLRKRKWWGMEIKYADAPKITRSIRVAQEDLKLEHVWIVYPGKDNYALDKQVSCVSIYNINQVLKQF